MPLRHSKVATHTGDKDFYLKVLQNLDSRWRYTHSLGPIHHYRLEIYD